MNPDDEMADRIAKATVRFAVRWSIRFLEWAIILSLAILGILAFAVWLGKNPDVVTLTVGVFGLAFFALLVAANVWHAIKWWRA
jgi:predicted membrane channel-forming protein YqfA (hemolysin III family)